MYFGQADAVAAINTISNTPIQTAPPSQTEKAAAQSKDTAAINAIGVTVRPIIREISRPGRKYCKPCAFLTCPPGQKPYRPSSARGAHCYCPKTCEPMTPREIASHECGEEARAQRSAVGAAKTIDENIRRMQQYQDARASCMAHKLSPKRRRGRRGNPMMKLAMAGALGGLVVYFLMDK